MRGSHSDCPFHRTVLNYLADTYPTYAASILAGNDFIHSMFACLCQYPFCCTSMANVSGWLASTPTMIMNRHVMLLGYHFLEHVFAEWGECVLCRSLEQANISL